jgi:PAS domain S-box-containing protein
MGVKHMPNQNKRTPYCAQLKKADLSDDKACKMKLLSSKNESIDSSLSTPKNSLSAKYELLLRQINNIRADSSECSNLIFSEIHAKYLVLLQIFNALNNGICALDSKRTIITANRKLLALLGKPMEEVIGGKCYEVFAGCEECGVQGYCSGERILRGESLVAQQTAIIDSHGERIPLTIISTPLTDMNGSTIGVVETFADGRMNTEELRRMQMKMSLN